MIDRSFLIQRDEHLLQFTSYEDYLESFITSRDLFHLRSKAISRQIIELGYHTEGTLTRDKFYEHVKAIERILYLVQNPYALCSEFIEPTDTFLEALKIREKANRYGELYTIIFMRHSGKSQSQISGYIDYSHRLKSEDWEPHFLNIKKITPQKYDLSYYNWKTTKSIVNESPNFKPIINAKKGIAFKNIHDSKHIVIDTSLNAQSDPARLVIQSKIYGQVILYDHHIEIKSDE